MGPVVQHRVRLAGSATIRRGWFADREGIGLDQPGSFEFRSRIAPQKGLGFRMSQADAQLRLGKAQPWFLPLCSLVGGQSSWLLVGRWQYAVIIAPGKGLEAEAFLTHPPFALHMARFPEAERRLLHKMICMSRHDSGALANRKFAGTQCTSAKFTPSTSTPGGIRTL